VFDLKEKEILKLGFSEAGLTKLKAYLQLLWTANEELNLVSRQMTQQDLVDNHVIDGLLPLRFFPSGARRVADFGTGGGLPGLLYAIQFPEVQFTLFEKSPKKQKFLQSCLSVTPNITIEGEIPSNFDGHDLVMARAFKPLDVILQMSREYFLDGGKYFLLKGRLEKIQEEISDAKKKIKTLNDSQIRIESLTSPVLEVERHLLLINQL
jgi:16S rRNA (guanine527-N7)-methyltransferase